MENRWPKMTSIIQIVANGPERPGTVRDGSPESGYHEYGPVHSITATNDFEIDLNHHTLVVYVQCPDIDNCICM